jgi:hypothetical protein
MPTHTPRLQLHNFFHGNIFEAESWKCIKILFHLSSMNNYFGMCFPRVNRFSFMFYYFFIVVYISWESWDFSTIHDQWRWPSSCCHVWNSGAIIFCIAMQGYTFFSMMILYMKLTIMRMKVKNNLIIISVTTCTVYFPYLQFSK